MPLHSALLTVQDAECGFSNKIMNRKIVTLGVAAFGVVGLQAADAGKVWEVTASLRGFYDDNYTTSPEELAEESWGIEVSPGINLTIGEGNGHGIERRLRVRSCGTTMIVETEQRGLWP